MRAILTPLMRLTGWGGCLDAVEVALEASGRETTVAQVVAANVQACIVVECSSSASWFPISFHGH
jgi:hypothetical protein